MPMQTAITMEGAPASFVMMSSSLTPVAVCGEERQREGGVEERRRIEMRSTPPEPLRPTLRSAFRKGLGRDACDLLWPTAPKEPRRTKLSAGAQTPAPPRGRPGHSQAGPDIAKTHVQQTSSKAGPEHCEPVGRGGGAGSERRAMAWEAQRLQRGQQPAG